MTHEVLMSAFNNHTMNVENFPYNETRNFVAEKMSYNNKTLENKQSRLLINPEFAESTDTSDGSEMFSPEDRKIEEEATRLD